MVIEGLEERFGGVVALVLQSFAEVFGFFGCGAGLIFQEADLDVEVADNTGGLADFFEVALDFFCRFAGRGKAGQEREEGEGGFDAAGGGAELVDGFRLGLGETEGHGGFEGGGLVSKGADGVRDGCSGHRGVPMILRRRMAVELRAISGKKCALDGRKLVA